MPLRTLWRAHKWQRQPSITRPLRLNHATHTFPSRSQTDQRSSRMRHLPNQPGLPKSFNLEIRPLWVILTRCVWLTSRWVLNRLLTTGRHLTTIMLSSKRKKTWFLSAQPASSNAWLRKIESCATGYLITSSVALLSTTLASRKANFSRMTSARFT